MIGSMNDGRGAGNAFAIPVKPIHTGKRYWKKIPNKCFCDDDPYTDACDFCLCQRGNRGYFSDEEMMEILQGKKDDY